MTLRNQDGTGLVLAILIIVVLFAIGAGLAFLTRTDVNISKHQTLHVESVFVAEAGVQEALHRLSLRDPTNITVNGSTINAAIGDRSLPLDPNWKARIFLCRPGLEPPAAAGEYHTATIQSAATWLEYSSANDLATAVTIEHKWKDLNDDGLRDADEIVLYDGARYPPENYASGSPVEVITVAGRSATARRTIRVEATRVPVNVNVRAALLCDLGVDIRGNVTVCGHNHSINAPDYSLIPDCVAWQHCTPGGDHIGEGCLTGVMTTGDEVLQAGSTDLLGYPTPMDTSSSNIFYTLAQTLGLTQAEIDVILANADYTYTNYLGVSPLDGITYIDGHAIDAQKLNNVTGSGLLYVTGDLEVSGNFVYKGLVYIEGDLRITGTPWILGAIVVKGSTEYAFSGGNPGILFSSDAIEQFIRQNLKYMEVGWKELSGI